MLSSFAVILNFFFFFWILVNTWSLEAECRFGYLQLLMRWSDWIIWKTKILSLMDEKYTCKENLGSFQDFSHKCISKLLVIVVYSSLLLVNLNMKTRVLQDSALLIILVNLYWAGVWKHLTTALPKTFFFVLLATRWEKKVIKTTPWCYQPSYP